jgi:hypothetical protein
MGELQENRFFDSCFACCFSAAGFSLAKVTSTIQKQASNIISGSNIDDNVFDFVVFVIA